jgi:hypothetical protein
MQKTYFPQAFLDKYQKLLGEDWKKFFETIKIKQAKSFWVNTNKALVPQVLRTLKDKKILYEPLPFHNQAYLVDCAEPEIEMFANVVDIVNVLLNVANVCEKEKFVLLPMFVLYVEVACLPWSTRKTAFRVEINEPEILSVLTSFQYIYPPTRVTPSELEIPPPSKVNPSSQTAGEKTAVIGNLDLITVELGVTTSPIR